MCYLRQIIFSKTDTLKPHTNSSQFFTLLADLISIVKNVTKNLVRQRLTKGINSFNILKNSIFMCKHCEKDFTEKSDLPAHLICVHNLNTKTTIKVCDLCGKSFQNGGFLLYTTWTSLFKSSNA